MFTLRHTLADPGSGGSLNQFFGDTHEAIIRAQNYSDWDARCSTPHQNNCPKYPDSNPQHTEKTGSSLKRQNTSFRSRSGTSHYFSQNAIVFKQWTSGLFHYSWWGKWFIMMTTVCETHELSNFIKTSLSKNNSFLVEFSKGSFFMFDDDSANAKWMCRYRFWYRDQYLLSNYLNSSESD